MTIVLKALAVLGIAAGGTFMATFALRPYKGAFEPLGLSETEWGLSALSGLLCGVVAAWRLARGSGVRRETDTFLDAVNGDHLG